jgi:predicted nuclease of predicted toxin-antitoxin system
MAFEEGRIVITLDKDFGELAVHEGERHCGILRLVGFSSQAEGSVAASAIDRYEPDFLAGAIVTIEPGRVRVRERDKGSSGSSGQRRDSPPRAR